MKTRVLFICHGNICRSTMCEFVFKHMAAELDLAEYFEIDSAATSREEIGNDTDPRTKRKLDQEGIAYTARRARQVTSEDYDYYDLLICADDANVRNTKRICGGDPEHKIVKLMEFAGSDRSIADPWYTHNFDITYDDVVEGCEALMRKMIEETRPEYMKVFAEHEKLSGFFSFKYGAAKEAPYDNDAVFADAGASNAMKVWLKQVHDSKIAVISKRSGESVTIPDTDGSVTNVPGVLLTTVHADCLPVYFYDPEHEAIGLVHAGWRGTDKGIAPECVRKMTDEYGTDPAKLKVFIGPGISQCCFEVGPEVRQSFLSHWPWADDYALPKGEKYYIDIKGINTRELIKAGVREENIKVSKHCTFHEPELFASYRREGGTYVRMGAGLMIKEK